MRGDIIAGDVINFVLFLNFDVWSKTELSKEELSFVLLLESYMAIYIANTAAYVGLF